MNCDFTCSLITVPMRIAQCAIVERIDGISLIFRVPDKYQMCKIQGK